jgi:hypothetical protein
VTWRPRFAEANLCCFTGFQIEEARRDTLGVISKHRRPIFNRTGYSLEPFLELTPRLLGFASKNMLLAFPKPRREKPVSQVALVEVVDSDG